MQRVIAPEVEAVCRAFQDFSGERKMRLTSSLLLMALQL
jgi:hypothetical protein